jgi:hypothetical protein
MAVGVGVPLLKRLKHYDRGSVAQLAADTRA